MRLVDIGAEEGVATGAVVIFVFARVHAVRNAAAPKIRKTDEQLKQKKLKN